METLLYAPAIGAFFNVAFDRMLNNSFLNFLTRRGSTEELVEELRRKMGAIEKLLADAEEKQTADEYVKSLLDEVKDALYVAEDLVHRIDTEALQHKTGAETVVAALGSLFMKDVDSEIRDIYQRLVNLEVEIKNLGLNEGQPTEPLNRLVDESEIFGRGDQKNKIIGYLGGGIKSNVNLSI